MAALLLLLLLLPGVQAGSAHACRLLLLLAGW
jgi:hypothetical protein